MRVKISDILKATGGKLLCGDENVVVTSFITDSRQGKAGAMFVPIRGERADGHDYIPTVLESPAAATFTDHEMMVPSVILSPNLGIFISNVAIF